MVRETGDRDFPIWLLGDSNPRNWQDQLKTPLDPRHPARHNIWSPILDGIQDRLFRQRGTRLDSSKIYIRNAVQDPTLKDAARGLVWTEDLNREIVSFRADLARHSPIFVQIGRAHV